MPNQGVQPGHKKVPTEDEWREANRIIGIAVKELKSWVGTRNANRAISSLEDAQDKVNRFFLQDLKDPQLRAKFGIS